MFGVPADLCTFAKAIANGYPISVVAGREEIMRKVGDGVVHGGTFTAHSVALAAADKTLEILAETDALANIAANGEQLRAGIDRILTARSIAHSFTGQAMVLDPGRPGDVGEGAVALVSKQGGGVGPAASCDQP